MRKTTPKKVTLLLSGLFMLSAVSQAQIVQPTTAEILITSGSADIDADNVNCDMIMHSGNAGALRAIAYDDNNTGRSFVQLDDYSGGSATISISDAHDIDVVIGDDMSSYGNDYIVAVVYNRFGVPTMETFTVTGTGTATLSYSSNGATALPAMASGFTQQPPHIDLYPDPANSIAGIPSLHEFVVTWNETSGSVFDIYAVTGDLQSYPAFGPSYPVTASGTASWPDVACLYDHSKGEAFAYISYTDGTSLDVFEINVTTASSGVMLTGINGTLGLAKGSRIEAMNNYDPINLEQRFEIVFSADPATGFFNIYSYNDLTGTSTQISPPAPRAFQIHPAVSAGAGHIVTGGYGNDMHTAAWYIDTRGVFYARAVDVTTGNISATYPGIYRTNLLPVSTTVYSIDDKYAPIAVSSTSNEGNDELLTAWVKDRDIYYKHKQAINQYKPSNINEAQQVDMKLYPNPAYNTITISGAEGATYTITDMTGKVLLTGNMPKGAATVNIESLADGMYMAGISLNGLSTVVKFAKQ